MERFGKWEEDTEDALPPSWQASAGSGKHSGILRPGTSMQGERALTKNR
jgi:hypothetical protein